MIPFWIKVLALGLILAALVAACHHRDTSLIEEGATKQREVDQAETDKLKAEAALKLKAVLEDKIETEKKLNEAHHAQEVRDAKSARDMASLAGRLAALGSVSGGRLLDPNAASGCGNRDNGSSASAASAPSAGGGNGAEAPGLLSAELTRLLQKLTSEADTINLAYISCRETVMEKTP